MTTGDAVKLVSKFGSVYNCDSFLDSLELMETMFKMGTLPTEYRIAYRITIGEMAEFV